MFSPTPLLVGASLLFFSALHAVPVGSEPDIHAFIRWLLDDGQKLESVPFPAVVEATTGKSVLPADPKDPETARVLEEISSVAQVILKQLNDPEHPVHAVPRINEVSGHIEDLLRNQLDAIDGFDCHFPVAANGRIQRAGYPDLRLVNERSGQIFYIDPKLYAEQSEGSSFRTFYFEPKLETNKIRDDAIHLILGIAHGGRQNGSWQFLRWQLIDLSGFSVRLKAEFQASNRDLYRPEVVLSSGKAAKEKSLP